MNELELDYGENKENCDHLVQRRNHLILAAIPCGFMEMFRFVVMFHVTFLLSVWSGCALDSDDYYPHKLPSLFSLKAHLGAYTNKHLQMVNLTFNHSFQSHVNIF